jgi:glycosyltransferase involved in cell wall biosynthesis
MKIQENFKPKVSVLVINHNNAKFIPQCINSIINQTYSNYEIIFFDDNSNDESLKVIKKLRKKKNFLLISNKKNNQFGSFNQMNGYYRALKKSKGDIIFFLDSDDFFHPNKIKVITEAYKKNVTKNVIMDMPIYKYPKKDIKKKIKTRLFNNYWPNFPPQSCISMKREFAYKVFQIVNFKKFHDIWLDFRVATYAQHKETICIINQHLTYYRQSIFQISSNFTFLGFNWWRRRYQAHQYIKYFFKKNNIYYKINIDYLICKFINFFIKNNENYTTSNWKK